MSVRRSKPTVERYKGVRSKVRMVHNLLGAKCRIGPYLPGPPEAEMAFRPLGSLRFFAFKDLQNGSPNLRVGHREPGEAGGRQEPQDDDRGVGEPVKNRGARPNPEE